MYASVYTLCVYLYTGIQVYLYTDIQVRYQGNTVLKHATYENQHKSSNV